MNGKFSVPDLVNLARVIRAADAKEDVTRFVQQLQKEPDSLVDTDVLFMLVDWLTRPKVDACFEAFVCGLTGMTAEEYRETDIFDLFDRLKGYTSSERWRDFFTRASGAAQRMSTT